MFLLFLYLRIDFAPLFVKLLLAGEIWAQWHDLANVDAQVKGYFSKVYFFNLYFLFVFLEVYLGKLGSVA